MKTEIIIPENNKLINFTHEVKTCGLKLCSKKSAMECFKITDYISKFRSVKPCLSPACYSPGEFQRMPETSGDLRSKNFLKLNFFIN